MKVESDSLHFYSLLNYFYVSNNIVIVLIRDEIIFVQIASAKSRSVRGASHQPDFMGNCLNISHMCLHCVPDGGWVIPCVVWSPNGRGIEGQNVKGKQNVRRVLLPGFDTWYRMY